MMRFRLRMTVCARMLWTMLAASAVLVAAAGGPAHAAGVTWAETYGGTGYEEATQVLQTADGGYIVGGATNSFGAGDSDVFVMKIDRYGQIQWQKTYGGAGTDLISDLQQTAEGGFVLAGSTNSSGAGGHDAWVLKLDAAGGIEWQKTYGGTGPDLFVSIRPTADGGYIAAGSYTYISDLWLVKLDAAGGIQWQETIGQWRADRAVLALPTADGGYFVEGRIYYGSGYNVWLMKLDANGSILWQEMLSLMGDGSGNGGRVTPDGGYILAVGAGSTIDGGKADFFATKLAADGTIEWQKHYGGGSYDVPNSIQLTADGGYVLAGRTSSFGAGASDMWVLKLDGAGSVQWQKTYGGAGDDVANSIAQTADGGYAIGGYTQSFGASRRSVWILKTDGNGDIDGCAAGLIGVTSAQILDGALTVQTPYAYLNVLGEPAGAGAAVSSDSRFVAGAVCAASVPVISVSPKALTFGPVEVPGSAAKTATITNVGAADLVISGVTVTGPGTNSFAAASSCGAIAPEASCTITVTFSAAETGTATADLVIASNDPAAPAVTVALSGTAIDTTPPRVSISVTPDLLWPPDHKMVTIETSISVSDNSPGTTVTLLSVTSSEPGDGIGDGNTANDIVVTGNGTISLRAERSGVDADRVYTITYQVTDSAGNTSSAAATVTVPHDRK